MKNNVFIHFYRWSTNVSHAIQFIANQTDLHNCFIICLFLTDDLKRPLKVGGQQRTQYHMTWDYGRCSILEIMETHDMEL